MLSDIDYMNRAIKLAKKGQYSCHPNPMVGCVLVKDNVIIAEAWHETAGQAHAEINAITDAQQKGHDTNGATAYVSLEPCSHEGKTPPCVGALINAGIVKVICATLDPNPQVSGQGLAKLTNAGIDARVLEYEQTQQAANYLNRAFFHRMRTGRPYVMLKIATTIDGKTADYQGNSQWITGSAARENVQQLRASSGAILTGSGTQHSDNPRLNVRLTNKHQPFRILLDTQLKLPVSANIIGDDKKLIIYTAVKSSKKITKLQNKVHAFRYIEKDDHSNNIMNVLNDLAELEINQLMIEAGATLSGSFLAADLVDEIVHYIAPSILGDQARAAFDLPKALSLNQKKQFTTHSCELLGGDIKIVFLRSLA